MTTVPALVEAQVARTPGAAAVVARCRSKPGAHQTAAAAMSSGPLR